MHDRVAEAGKRKKQIQQSLTELDEHNRKRAAGTANPPLKKMLVQAGLKIDVRTFYVYSLLCGIVLCVFAFVMGVPPLYLIGVLFAGVLGVPRWFVVILRNRRMKAFLDEFPNAHRCDRPRHQVRPAAQ